MRVLLVDDERLLLASLLRSLKVARPAWQVATASDGLEAMRCLASNAVDVLVTDLQMPGMDGMALLRQVRKDPALARLPLLLISGQDDRLTVRTGMNSGADDYLTKPFTAEELIQAIEGRMRRLESAGEGAGGASELQAQLEARLTQREREVLALVGQGLVTKEIAAELGLSPKTVSIHRQHLMEKLDLHNAAALAALAIRASLA